MPAEGVQSNYAVFLAAGAGLAALLFIPGWALRRRWPAAWLSAPEYAPLPGMALLAAAGAATFLLGPGLSPWPGRALLAINLALLTAGAWRPAPRPPDAWGWRKVWLCYGALVAAVATDSVMRAPMVQDFWAGTTLQSRMPASPPDSAIPYKTAAYLTLPQRSAALSDRFFSPDWTARSRGPLVPLLILAAFDFAPPRVEEGADPGPGPWPAARDGFYLARWIGILTNACVLFGGAAVLRALGADVRSSRLGLVWMTLAPVTWINTAFVWPKLLAAYFLFLAAAESLAGRRRPAAWTDDAWIGLLLAAAYLSHPIGALFAPVLLLLHALARQPRLPSFGRAAAAAALGALPWILIKAQSHHPHPDLFLRYPWGDGRGHLAAASVGSWLRARGLNLWYSLAPGAWFFWGPMRGWFDGPLPPHTRWAIQAAKTLPAGIGFSTLPIAIFSLLRRPSPPAQRFGGTFLAGGLLLAVLYWGFSDDGLGRNCLEPLTLGAILWASHRWPLADRHSRLLLILLGVETLVVIGLGLVWRSVTGLDLALLATVAVLLGVPLSLLFRRPADGMASS